jgi:hypothetical protein
MLLNDKWECDLNFLPDKCQYIDNSTKCHDIDNIVL